MNAHKKIFFISSFLLSILFICLFSHSIFAQIEAEKTIGFEKKNETLLDKEAFGFVNTIINQHWLINDNSWFTLHHATFLQMKDVSYEVKRQEIREVDRMNGIEWNGYFYLYPKFAREGREYKWDKWHIGNEWVGYGLYERKRNYRYAVNKEEGKWTIIDVRRRAKDCGGWCSISFKKPKIEELPDFAGSGKLKENYNTKEREYAPYYKHIKDKIRLYWLLQYGTDTSVNQVTSEDKPVVITFKVLPSGKIVNVKVTEVAGNDVLASKVQKSIQNTKLDKFPDYICDNYINVKFSYFFY